jgi:hypothetical protein
LFEGSQASHICPSDKSTKWRWMWSNGGMILTGKEWNTIRQAWFRDNLYITCVRWNDRESSPDIRNERSENNRVNHLKMELVFLYLNFGIYVTENGFITLEEPIGSQKNNGCLISDLKETTKYALFWKNVLFYIVIFFMELN